MTPIRYLIANIITFALITLGLKVAEKAEDRKPTAREVEEFLAKERLGR